MFQIALGGIFPEDPGIEQKLNELMRQIRDGLSSDGGVGALRLLYSPAFADGGWWPWMQSVGCGVSGYGTLSESKTDARYDQLIEVDTPLRTGIGEMLCDEADMLLMVWNEEVTENASATWELLRLALKKHVPCVWVSSKTGELYWLEDTCYGTFQPEKLRSLCRLSAQVSLEPEMPEEKHIPLLFIGQRIYKRFMKKFKAGAKARPGKEDLLLSDSYRLDAAFADGEALRASLLERYHRFDSAAITLNDRFLSILYWRSVLPIITTLFVAVGFYAPSVFAAIPIFSKSAWSVIAGIGFLIHGFLNFYVFALSRSETIQDCQAGAIRNRQMAELLRVLLHFAPFGIHLDLRKLSGGDESLSIAARRMTQEHRPRLLVITHENEAEALEHVEELLSDQIAYHAVSRDRCTKVVERLERWSGAVFYLSFLIVLLRSALQFVFALPSFPSLDMKLGNGVGMDGFVRSFANMLALLTPAWYSHYVSRLTLGNYRFNRDNHERMLSELGEKLASIEALRSSGRTTPSEALQDIGESIAETMLLRDNTAWAKKYRGLRISHL